MSSAKLCRSVWNLVAKREPLLILLLYPSSVFIPVNVPLILPEELFSSSVEKKWFCAKMELKVYFAKIYTMEIS